MNILIVDDEAPARDRLARMLADLEDFDVVGQAASGREALQLITDREPDVVLLDIRMPEIDGIETARHLAKMATPPAVIFTTAFDDYAIDAFDAQAIGYLLKPVRRERLEKALRRASRLARPQLDALARETHQPPRRSSLCIRKGGEIRLIPVHQIVSFQAEQKYVVARHRNGEDLVDDSLRTLAEEFGDRFIRIHRSVLAAVDCLERLDRDSAGRYRVWLRGSDTPLPVSRRHLSDVKLCLKRTR